MKSHTFLILFVLLFLSVCSQAQLWTGILKPTSGSGACSYGQITSAGQCAVDWTNVGIPGGIPATWTQSGSTIAATGSDQTSAINSALSSCGTNHFVQLGTGTFVIKGTITVKTNCFLNGNGPQSTVLNLSASGAHVELGSFNDGPYKNGTCTITAGNTAGSTTITLSAKGLDNNPCGAGVGGYLVISELNDPVYVQSASPQNPGGCGYCDGIWSGTREREQIVEMESVSGSGPYTVTISPALYTNYGVATGTSPAYATPMGADSAGVPDCKYCGVENLQLYANGYSLSAGTPDMDMTLCAYCWVHNVEFNYTDADWIDMNWCYRCQIDDNYFFNSYGHGAGGSDADVSPRLETTASLIVNNIFERGHAHVMVSEGAAGNVVAYNYSTGAVDAVGSGGQLMDFSEHGAFPQFNLWEGNVGADFNPDSWHGNNGYNTLFRNWFQGNFSIATYPPKAMTSGTCAAGTCTITWASGSSPFVTGQYVVLDGTNQSGCGAGTTSTPWQWGVWAMTGPNTFASGPCTSWTGGNAFTLDLKPLTPPISHTGTGAVVFTNNYGTYQALWPMAIPAFSVGNSFIGNVLGSSAMESVTGSGNLDNSGSGCSACMRVATNRIYTQNSASLVSAGAKAPTSSWNYDTSGDSSGSIWMTFPGGPSSTEGYWSNQGYTTSCYHENFDIASASTINNINCSPNTALPESFFLSAKPSWWVNAFGAAPPWPAIGPDVSGGPDTATAGHANYIPAELCYNGLSRDSTGAKEFDANACYGSTQAPAPPTGLAAVVH
jgi:hypothetical protein